MTKFIPLLIALILHVPQTAHADDTVLSKATSAMKQSASYLHSISVRGGYAGFTSLDLSIRWGEGPKEVLTEQDIWAQPPGTSKIGQSFLKAFEVTGDRFYLNLARDAARAMALSQTGYGGWNQIARFAESGTLATTLNRRKGRCTFDDNVTQNAILFLMELDGILDEQWLDNAIGMGLDFMMMTQFDNGAWAQGYPPAGNYKDHYTFNDNVINDCIRVMIEAHRRYGKSEYLDSMRRGGDFIIRSRLDSPQAGWAQQYSHDMKPAPARKYEHPSVCSLVTSSNIRMLIDIYIATGDKKYLDPIPDALTWLERSGIGENLWARFYELDSNRPLYSDKNGVIIYSVDQAREGYTWQSDYRIQGTFDYYKHIMATELASLRKDHGRQLSPAERDRQIGELIPRVEESLASLDDTGRWINPESSMIHARDFVRNFSRLVSYVELVGGDAE